MHDKLKCNISIEKTLNRSSIIHCAKEESNKTKSYSRIEMLQLCNYNYSAKVLKSESFGKKLDFSHPSSCIAFIKTLHRKSFQNRAVGKLLSVIHKRHKSFLASFQERNFRVKYYELETERESLFSVFDFPFSDNGYKKN